MIIDGTVQQVHYPDDTFDIVMSGHVIGDDYNTEIDILRGGKGNEEDVICTCRDYAALSSM